MAKQQLSIKNKAFIFDWSGTLSDNFPNYCKVCRLIFVEMGISPISDEEIRLNVTIPYMKFWNKYIPNITIEEQDQLYRKYMDKAGKARIFKEVPDTLRL
jgi:phosphoglycolate phosphatase-like HAD superfamily hydrolase